VPLHYESSIDSGDFDTEVDFTPVRVDNAQLDGWTVTQAGWHHALGMPGSGELAGLDGVVGFGGRQGQNWLKYRLQRVGYIHRPTRAWDDIGGAPDYNRGNLTRETKTLELITLGEIVPVTSSAVWNRIWTTPGGGEANVQWRCYGGKLIEEITLNEAARNWIAANRPPTTPLSETYFSFAFRLDVSDIPKAKIQGILQDFEGDFDADDGLFLEDSQDRPLATFPIDYVFTGRNTENEVREKLHKRFYKDGGNYWLVMGVRCDTLNNMPAGDLLFDPIINLDPVTASADDAYENTIGGVSITQGAILINEESEYFAARWDLSIANGSTISTGYFRVYNTTASRPFEYDIYVENADSAAAYAESSNDISGRTYHTLVDWSAGSQGAGWVQSPSIASELQSTVGRAGWSSGNYGAIAFDKTTGESAGGVIDSYDNEPNNAAQIYADYTAPGGVTVTPAHAEAQGAGIAPSVVLGSLSVSPAQSEANAASIDPAVVLGSLGLSPAEAIAQALAQTPIVVQGSLALAPAQSEAQGSAIAPAVVLGSLAISPAQTEALAAGIAPTVVLGSVSVTPAISETLGSALDPTVQLGGELVTPAHAEAQSSVVAPTVVLGNLVIAPDGSIAQASSVAPTIILGSTSASPAPAEAQGSAVDPTVVLGALVLVPAHAEGQASAVEPIVVLGPIQVTPAVANALGSAQAPTIVLGSTSVTPAQAEAIAAAIAPTVQEGVILTLIVFSDLVVSNPINFSAPTISRPISFSTPAVAKPINFSAPAVSPS
jgi:hypothetical protein